MKNKAFTLAEVLITLGIIGVVAAITIPTLINQYKKHVYYTQFRKAASQLEQALKLYQIDHGCEGDISACGTSQGNHIWIPVYIPHFVEDLAKYFNGAQLINEDNSDELCSYEKIPTKPNGYDFCINDIGIDGTYAFKTVDGSFYNFSLDEGVGNGSIVDINGPYKGPNEMGRDIFVFYMHYFKDQPVTHSGIVWGGNPNYDNEPCDDNNVNQRLGCAARLMREGKMNY